MAELKVAESEDMFGMTRPLDVAADTVQVWAFKTSGTPEIVEFSRSLLSVDEKDRADRFVFEHHRTRYTVSHGVVRWLLALYCRGSARELQFQANDNGKPSLVTPASSSAKAPPISFNLAHSSDQALLAISDGRPIGVDLEHVRENFEALEISRRYFFGTERDAIEHARSPETVRTFFKFWVCKEALLKAHGSGLSLALDKFAVEFRDQTRAQVRSLDLTLLNDGWIVELLPTDAAWAGAVCAMGKDWLLSLERPR